MAGKCHFSCHACVDFFSNKPLLTLTSTESILISIFTRVVSSPWLCSTCVATELGRGSARGARKAALIGQSLALAFGLCTMTLSLMVHKQWPLLFVSKREHEVLALSLSLMVIASFMAITDAFQNNCGGEAMRPRSLVSVFVCLL